MRKMMRKVKSQWIAGSLFVLAVVGVGIRDVSAEDTIDLQQDSHLKDFEIQLGDTLWGNVPNYQVAIKNRASVEVIKSYGNRALYKGENGLLNGKGNFEKKIDNKGKVVIIAKPAGNESPTKPPVAKGPKVAIVTTDSIKETVTTPYETVYIEDETLSIGEKTVTQIGVDGLKTNTYTVTFINGIEKKRTLSNTEVTTEPINQVIAIGTKAIPVVTTKTEQSTETIPYETTIQEDASLLIGETKVIQPGVNGSKTHTYTITFTDGVETNRELSNTEITIAPVNEIVAIGTKVVETKVETVTENVVAFETRTQEDDTIPIGETHVVQAGSEGYDTVTYEVTYTNGIETNRVETSRNTTSPVEEITIVGTKASNVELNSDTEAPEVLNLSVEQGPVSPGDSVKVTAEIIDDKSGVNYVYAVFTAPSGNKSDSVMLYRTSGNTYTGEIGISEYKEIGTWNLDYIYVGDSENNGRYLYANDLATIADNTSFIIVDANSDTEAPDVLQLSVEQGVMLPGDSVTITAEIIDDKSGVNYVYAVFTAPSGNKSDSVMLYRTSGNTYTGEIGISEYKEIGTWDLYYIYVGDSENNGRYLYANDLATITDKPSFTVGTN